jgi:arylsulfatase A-like enzyme
VSNAKRRGEDTNKYAFEWLEKKPQEPFFLLVHYNDPHWPYNPPPPFGQEYVKGYQGELTPSRTGAVVEQQGKPITNLSSEDLEYIIGLYDGEVAYTDSNVGRLLEKLRSVGFQRDFLTVVTSDHGEEFLDHGSASHGYTLYEEQIRVPLILNYPGRLGAAHIEAQVRLIDVLPTVLDLAGINGDLTEGLQGESLVPLMAGKKAAGPGDAYSEATYVGDRKAVRTEKGLKLILSFAGEKAMLFDLRSDPKEQMSLLEDDPSLGERLRENLSRWVQSNEVTRIALYGEDEPDQEVVLDAETQERLKALGYIQ